jgi:tetratricopeptide (TPR) repeat protein
VTAIARAQRSGTAFRHHPVLAELWQPDHALWHILTISLSLVALYYFFHIWYRWGRPDPDFLAFSVNVLQIVSFISVAGLLTAVGHEFVTTTWQKVTARHGWLGYPRTRGLAALIVVLVMLLTFYVGLPLRARHLNNQGVKIMEQGRYNLAVQKLSYAASLAPENASYHYNLGRAYASANVLDQAQNEFQQALALDDSFWPVYNELALLHLRTPADPETALIYALAGNQVLARLATAAAYPAADLPFAQGTMQRDIGHVYLALALPQAALTALDKAIAFFDEYEQRTGNRGATAFHLAETYRLRALAYEAQEKTAAATASWLDGKAFADAVARSPACQANRGLANPNCLLVSQWLAEAAERLDQQP